jgi:hypothetical protein
MQRLALLHAQRPGLPAMLLSDSLSTWGLVAHVHNPCQAREAAGSLVPQSAQQGNLTRQLPERWVLRNT